ncbi:MAG: 1-acyl-sn-glycerol-3-phosphate acyltransferase [Deltaproteobacteria bacterium]|nr:1-acyl-sn-glycerol-3-phosphate acyltransferase [Deltaproteobacteria bacterium]
MMRKILNILIIIMATVFLGSVAILITIITRNNKSFIWCTYKWTNILINWCGISVKKNILCGNEEFVPPILFMSNHQSHYDIPTIYSTLPIFTMFLAKKELRKIPFLGWAMWLVGFVFIDRKNRDEAFKAIDEAARQFVEEKKSIVVFPEGTRSKDGSIGQFKKGGFHLAIQAKAKIIPIGIWGTINILPKGSWLVSPGKVVINIGKPIDASKYTRDSLGKLMDDVKNAIEFLTEKSKSEWEKGI